MAGVPVKFRCYQCNRLLGVAQSKVGSVVSCPKCGAGLVVPPPAPEDASASENDVTEGSSPYDPPPGSRDGGVSFDFLDLRPEDIRVEPGVDPIPYSPPIESPRAVEEPWTPPITLREREAPAPPPPPQPPPPLVAPTTYENPPAANNPPSEEVIPPIRLDGPRPNSSRTLPVRSRDVVLPRSAVASWCLFVLLAQGLAFLAGLLAGHFLWRVH